MADENMPWTLRRVTEENDLELLGLATEVIREYHEDLGGARIAWFLRDGKDKAWWGMARRASEEQWMLSGGIDLSVQVNETLWKSHLLTTKGRRFLLDFLLSRLAAKTEGKTHMEVEDGEPRQLYAVERQDILGLAALIARHPEGHAELAELAAIHKAITEPVQYLLDLERAAADDADEDDEEESEEEPTDPRPLPEPVAYYKARFVDLRGEGQVKVTLRFEGAGMDVEELTGVHVHVDQGRKPGLPDMVPASSYDYDGSGETLQVYRAFLIDELEDKRRAALPADDLGDESGETEVADNDSEEPMGAVVGIGRGKGRRA